MEAGLECKTVRDDPKLKCSSEEVRSASDFHAWRVRLREITPKKISGIQMGVWLRDAVLSLPGSLGDFARQAASTGTEPGSAARGVLPLDPGLAEVQGKLLAEEKLLPLREVGSWCWVIAVLLNFMSVGMEFQKRGVVKPRAEDRFTQEARLRAAKHVAERVAWFFEVECINDWAQIVKDARERKFAYNGEVVSVRRELVASKVLPTWPEKGRAGVVQVTEFLDEELRRDYKDPRRCVLPRDQWPEKLHVSRVYASQDG